MNKNKGFTLIELLVVIAIIGILSSVVLASLNSARAKGADAAIKSNLANMRVQAEMYYDGTGAGKYGAAAYYDNAGACDTAGAQVFSDPTMRAAFAAAESASGLATGVCTVLADGSAWAAAMPLKSTSTNFWCVDSTGASKQVTGITTLSATDAAC